MSDLKALIQNSTINLTREFDLITNNLANVSTAGYKRRCNFFSKVLAAQKSNGEKDTSYNETAESGIDFTQGNINQTGRPLDVALYGKGFFTIETPDGPLYTRNGMFDLNEKKQIVDMQGRTVAGESGVITLPPGVSVSDVHISGDGRISANGIEIDQFKIVDFGENEDKLSPAGLHCFTAPASIKADDAEIVSVKQGYQEGSNVQIVDEMVDMIMVQRLYSANMRFLTATKDSSKSLMSVAMG